MDQRDPNVVVFICQWCLKAQIDWLERCDFSDNVKVVQVPCSGRVNPLYVVSALQAGTDGVMVVGCAPGECQYKSGNLLAERKLGTLKELLDYAGLESRRFRCVWIGATEQGRFRRLVREMIRDLKNVGPGGHLATQTWDEAQVTPVAESRG